MSFKILFQPDKFNIVPSLFSIAVFEGDRNLDVTFGDLERSKKFSLIAPTGITIDGSGNIFVADRVLKLSSD